MSERLQMQGKLVGLEQDKHRLKMRIDGLCRSIRTLINPALMDIGDMDIPMASQQMRDLEMAFVELQGVDSRITRLKRELGLG